MNTEPISPWIDRAERKSPNNTMTALFENGMEIAMGAPTLGTLSVILSDGRKKIVSEDAAASFVWSDDSRFIAYSRWRGNRNQNLCVFKISDLSTDVSPDEFRVLELRNFTEGKIEGIDSPVYQPRTFSLEYKN
ncbi:hypothetical protein ACFLQY_01275 [Verrucomicrobiota bacterium]